MAQCAQRWSGIVAIGNREAALRDPDLFHLDWEHTFEVLAAVFILAFVVERALAPLFENRWWLARLDN